MSVRILVLACLTYQKCAADDDLVDVDTIVVKSVAPQQSGFRALSSLLYYSTLPSQRPSGGMQTFRNRRTDYASDYGPRHRDGMVGTNRYGRSHGRGFQSDFDRMGYSRGRYSAGMEYNRGHHGTGMSYNREHYGAGMGYNRGQYVGAMSHNREHYGAGMGYNRDHYGAGVGYNRGHYEGSHRMRHHRGHYSGVGNYDWPFEQDDYLSYSDRDHHWADDY